MVSVASRGTAERIAARSFDKVLRAGSGTAARYPSIFFGAPTLGALELLLPDFTFFMRAKLRESSSGLASVAKPPGRKRQFAAATCIVSLNFLKKASKPPLASANRSGFTRSTHISVASGEVFRMFMVSEMKSLSGMAFGSLA